MQEKMRYFTSNDNKKEKLKSKKLKFETTRTNKTKNIIYCI